MGETWESAAALRPRAAAFAALAVALATTATHWLATAEWTQPVIEAPPGLSATGEVAVVEATDAAVAGTPLLSVGRTVARLRLARDYTVRVRVAVAWTNVVEVAGTVDAALQLDVGLYRPVSTARLGACSTPGALAVTDGGTTFCVVRDAGAGGSPVVGGTLALARESVTGYLLPSVDGAAAQPCLLDTGAPTAWCRPGGALADDDRRVLYVVALVTAGDALALVDGAVAAELEFAVRVRPAG